MEANTWNDGYLTEINYTYGYYANLNPLQAKLAFLQKQVQFPAKIETACELGFGQGVSLNIHAAASKTEWYGTDFNPSQAAFAADLASVSKAHIYDDSFQDFIHNPNLPDFDYIGLHGIWSWISDANRQAIVDFIAKKLKLGGVLYISYNTFPGWAAMAPVRHLMTQHAATYGSAGHGVEQSVASALEFVEKLFATKPTFAAAQPLAVQRFENTKTMDKHYLAHEYFNKDWEPCYFTDMNNWLSQAKLTFVGSAHIMENVDAVTLTDEQRKLVAEVKDPVLEQQLRDYMINQQFRRDYWVKGARRVRAMDAIRELPVVLTTPRVDVPMEVPCPQGKANLKEELYAPILDALSDHKPHTVGELVGSQTIGTVWQAVCILAGAGHVYPVAEADAGVKTRCSMLNRKIRALPETVSYQASPVIAGGIAVNEIDQLFLTAEGKDCAVYAFDTLKQRGKRVVRDGKALDKDDEALAELRERAKQFTEKKLPVYKALGIA